jgi:Family of unknown function (DUF6252)
MKKTVAFILILIALISCQEDVKFNEVAVQGYKDGVLWQAESFKATLTSNGYLVINASKGFETLTMRTSSIAPHTSTFGTSFIDYAEFKDATTSSFANFSTGQIGGSGQIVITDYSSGTVSGTFKFEAIDVDDATKKTIFRIGTIYKIPVKVIQ